ncbi:MAG: hypothetical protein ABFC24_11275, partial [Methanoregulaceae archaeon]
MKARLILIAAIAICIVLSGCTSRAPMVQNVTEPTEPVPVVQNVTVPLSTIEPTPIPITKTPTVSATRPPDFKAKGSVDKSYYYIVDGTPGYIPLEVYSGVNEYIASFGDIYTGNDFNAVVNNSVQREYVGPMVQKIRSAAKNPDDEARIAISLVQHIKYDANAINEIRFNESRSGQLYIGRYPYTILYQNWGGICGEKSFLLALLLKELGYDVALLEFDDVHHMAVGIRAPREYCYGDTEYALIESTAPEIPTFDEYTFVGFNIPMSSLRPTKTFKISEGKSFDSIGKEVSDAQTERSILLAAGVLNAAAANVRISEQQLEYLSSQVTYWKKKVESDLANRSS